MATLFNQVTRELIDVTENGKTRTMTRVEAVFRQITNKALSGDPRVMKEFIQLSRLFEDAERNEPVVLESSERDDAVLASLRRRLARMHQSDTDEAEDRGDEGESDEKDSECD